MLSRMRGQVNEGQRVTSKSKGWLAINLLTTFNCRKGFRAGIDGRRMKRERSMVLILFVNLADHGLEQFLAHAFPFDGRTSKLWRRK
jgi:hypothetical protein